MPSLIFINGREVPYIDHTDLEKQYNGWPSLTHDVLPLVKLLEEVCTPGKDIEAPCTAPSLENFSS